MTTRDDLALSGHPAETTRPARPVSTAPRLLRGSRLRNALFLAVDGRCARCTVALAPGWHADHIDPWCRTGRTNVHEMQALCPRCNAQKGAR